MAQANVEVKVQSQDLDKLKGKLVELQKGLKIQYDIDGKPIDIVIDKTINLQKQLVILQKERKKVSEGSAEFKLLSEKIGDTEDALARSNAKSRDLLASLQLIPGPVGQFAGQLNGAIGLLKTFSSFSIKDLRFQFKQTVDDIKDIFGNLSGASEGVDDLDNKSKSASDSVKELGGQVQKTAENSAGLGAIVGQQSADLEGLIVNLNKTSLSTNDLNKAVNQLTSQGFDVQIDTLKNADGVVTDTLVSYTDLNGEIKLLNKSQLQAAASGAQFQMTEAGLVTTTNSLTTATNAATASTIAWGAAIRGLLIATGIGALVVLIGAIIGKLVELYDALSSTEEEAAALNRTLERQKQLYDDLAAGIDVQTQINVERAKQAGKTEEEIFQIRKQGLIDQLTETRKAANESAQIEAEARAKSGKFAKLSEDERLKILNDANKQKQDLFNKEIDLTRQIELENEREKTRIAEKGRKDAKSINDKRLQDNKQFYDNLAKDTKAGLDELKKLTEENYLATIQDERKREQDRLVIEFENERKRIKSLEINTEKKNQILEQLDIRFKQKLDDLNKKFDKQQEDRIKSNNKKMADLKISAIENESERTIAKLQQSYDEELKELLDAKKEELKVLNLTNEQILEIENRYNQAILDLNKKSEIEISDFTKKKNEETLDKEKSTYEERLRLLQLKSGGLIEGTRAFYKNAMEILKVSEQQEIDEAKRNGKLKKKSAEEIEAEITDIQKKYSLNRQQLRQKELESYLGIAQQIGSTFSSFISTQNETNRINEQNQLKEAEGNAQAQDQIKKTYFEKNKKASIASAYISTFQAAIDAYLSMAKIPTVGPVLGGIAAAAALFFGQQQISAIRAQTYDGLEEGGMPVSYGRGMARGGLIEGPRHAQGGVMLEAEGGEAVMTRGAVSMFGPLLSMMNQAGGGTNFNQNMMFTANDAPVSSIPDDPPPVVLKTYIVSNELTSEQEKQARLKQLSTL